MKLDDLTQRAGEWLRGKGPMHDVVISTRLRLARNVADMPFLTKCSRLQQHELELRLRTRILDAGIASEMLYVDVQNADEMDRQLLVERHRISRQHGEASHPRGVGISADETGAIMVNEEDHLRIQVLRSGLELDDAFTEVNRIDDLLEDGLDYAFHSRYGYLTACPTNVGTGMRVSVMLHLPALKMTGEIEKAFRAARDMKLAIRGLYGEGTEATGDFFQISNQTTLGKSEGDFVREFQEILPQFIEYERQGRKSLMQRRSIAVEDKVQRAVSLLRAAKLISSEETMYLLSLVRLGVHMGLVRDIDVERINKLFLITQPAHLQRILGKALSGPSRAEARAKIVRQRLATTD